MTVKARTPISQLGADFGVKPVKSRLAARLPEGLILLLIFFYASGAYVYMVARFDGRWIEGDTARITQVIAVAQNTDTILRSPQPYTNGISYTAVVLVLSEIAGISPQILQTLILPLLCGVSVTVFYVTYRLLLRERTAALIATLFVFLQPDFLWVTWRGSHEKITWIIVLLLFFTLARSFLLWSKTPLLVRFMFIFYLLAAALMMSNVLFASSFVVALTLSFVGGVVFFQVRRRRKLDFERFLQQHLIRLIYVGVSCLILLYLFLFYIYPVALTGLRALNTLGEQLAALFLNTESTTTEGGGGGGGPVAYNAYAYINQAWLSTGIFLVLTLFNWLILAGSGVTWLVGAVRMLRRNRMSRNNLPQLFLWLLYPAFAIQLAMSVFADQSGSLGGNLQVRLFAPLLLIAIPIAALGLQVVITFIQRRFPSKLRILLYAVLLIPFLWFSLASVLKATNEPLVSNKWIFRTHDEDMAASWIMTYVKTGPIATGADERLATAFAFDFPEKSDQIDLLNIIFSTSENFARYYLLSSFEQQRMQRSGFPVPYLDDRNLVYNNGDSRIYHRRAQTPYQR